MCLVRLQTSTSTSIVGTSTRTPIPAGAALFTLARTLYPLGIHAGTGPQMVPTPPRGLRVSRAERSLKPTPGTERSRDRRSSAAVFL